MRFSLGIGLWILVAGTSLSASTIDVTSQTTLLLQTGDSLEFVFGMHSFSDMAVGMGLSPYPSLVDFTFYSLPLNLPGQFKVALAPLDGVIATRLTNPVSWTSGTFQSSGYTGPTSAVTGVFALSSSVSQAIFLPSQAELILTYSGPDIDLGVPGNTLRQDLSVSLSEGPLSVGGMVNDVKLIQPSGTEIAMPEPNSVTLLTAGVGFCLFAGVLKRLRRRNRALV